VRNYIVNIEWLFKGRYPLSSTQRIRASNIRAAVGKSLASKRKGFRDVEGAVLAVRITNIGAGLSAQEEELCEKPFSP